ncbi:hypothetical protein D1007_01604 [Hordeum vulgare]|nr:hypothetical protein D1007_01604 [Hordeum vulgare]
MEALVKCCKEEEFGLKEHKEATKTREATLSHRDSELARGIAEQVAEHGHLDVLWREDAGYARFCSVLMKALEGVIKKVDNTLEEKCHDLLSLAVIRVFIHLLLLDPCFEFARVMCPVHEESHGDMATAMRDHVRTLLKKFTCDDDEESDKDPPPCPETNHLFLEKVLDLYGTI